LCAQVILERISSHFQSGSRLSTLLARVCTENFPYGVLQQHLLYKSNWIKESLRYIKQSISLVNVSQYDWKASLDLKMFRDRHHHAQMVWAHHDEIHAQILSSKR
jgi:hypothetical protein